MGLVDPSNPIPMRPESMAGEMLLLPLWRRRGRILLAISFIRVTIYTTYPKICQLIFYQYTQDTIQYIIQYILIV